MFVSRFEAAGKKPSGSQESFSSALKKSWDEKHPKGQDVGTDVGNGRVSGRANGTGGKAGRGQSCRLKMDPQMLQKNFG